MKTKEKNLLLKDLCARLPYGVECYYDTQDMYYDGPLRGNSIVCGYSSHPDTIVLESGDEIDMESIKLYLRPMLSMTEMEQKEFDSFCGIDETLWKGSSIMGFMNQAELMADGIDWLNAHHFDYRGLIEKGLALEAPKGMYKTE